MQWPSENDNEKVYFACVDKPLLLVHPRNCPLVPVDDSCELWLLCISFGYQSITGLHSMICDIYILLPCFCIILPRFCSVFNKTALLSANPQIQEFFFMFSIMKKNRLHSNNSLSSETVSVSVQFQFIFFAGKKNTYAYRHSIYYIIIYILRNTHQKAMS